MLLLLLLYFSGFLFKFINIKKQVTKKSILNEDKITSINKVTGTNKILEV